MEILLTDYLDFNKYNSMKTIILLHKRSEIPKTFFNSVINGLTEFKNRELLLIQIERFNGFLENNKGNFSEFMYPEIIQDIQQILTVNAS